MTLIGQLLDKKGRHVWTIDANDSVYQAIKLMAEQDIGAVVVIDDGKMVGIFTERHYARNVFLEGRTSPRTRVGDVMRSDPITINEAQHLGECIHVMERERVRHAPVMEDSALVGIVSMGDILRAVISEERLDVASLMKYITRAR